MVLDVMREHGGVGVVRIEAGVEGPAVVGLAALRGSDSKRSTCLEAGPLDHAARPRRQRAQQALQEATAVGPHVARDSETPDEQHGKRAAVANVGAVEVCRTPCRKEVRRSRVPALPRAG